jgi:hypothetical protein
MVTRVRSEVCNVIDTGSNETAAPLVSELQRGKNVGIACNSVALSDSRVDNHFVCDM